MGDLDAINRNIDIRPKEAEQKPLKVIKHRMGKNSLGYLDIDGNWKYKWDR